MLHNQPLLSRKINNPNSPLVRENVKQWSANYSLGCFPIHFAFSSPRQCLCSLSASPAKSILVIWHWRMAGRYSAVIIQLLDYQCVASKCCIYNFGRKTVGFKIRALFAQVRLWLNATFILLNLSSEPIFSSCLGKPFLLCSVHDLSDPQEPLSLSVKVI